MAIKLYNIWEWELLENGTKEEEPEVAEDAEECWEDCEEGYEEECEAEPKPRVDKHAEECEEKKEKAKKRKVPVQEYKDADKMPTKEKLEYMNALNPPLRPYGKVVYILQSQIREKFVVGLVEKPKEKHNYRHKEAEQATNQEYDAYKNPNSNNYESNYYAPNYKKRWNKKAEKQEEPAESKPSEPKPPTYITIAPTKKCFAKMDIINPELVVAEPEEYYLCQYLEWDISRPVPAGKIIKSVGKAGSIEGETARALADYWVFPTEFSPEALAELKSLAFNPFTQSVDISEDELKKRRDLRGKRIFTVDNEDTKDIDDAVHVEKIAENVYELGVHIADVSFYVKPGTCVDKEAQEKATSVYLVHKVHPMLPELLTNIACSLNPNVDRFAFSVIFRVNNEGELIKDFVPQMFKSIMRSRSKMSYNTVQAIIDGKFKTQADLPAGREIHGKVITTNNRLHL